MVQEEGGGSVEVGRQEERERRKKGWRRRSTRNLELHTSGKVIFTYLIRVTSRRTVVTFISKTIAIFVCLFSVRNQWTVIEDIF